MNCCRFQSVILLALAAGSICLSASRGGSVKTDKDQAEAAFYNGDYQEAYDLFSRIREEREIDSEALARLAISALHTRRYEEVLRLFDRAVEKDPANLLSHLGKARCLGDLAARARKEDNEDKRTEYLTMQLEAVKKALAISPGNADANMYLINIHRSFQIRAVKKPVPPGSPPRTLELVMSDNFLKSERISERHLAQAQVYLEAKQYTDAVELIRKARNIWMTTKYPPLREKMLFVSPKKEAKYLYELGRALIARSEHLIKLNRENLTWYLTEVFPFYGYYYGREDIENSLSDAERQLKLSILIDPKFFREKAETALREIDSLRNRIREHWEEVDAVLQRQVPPPDNQ